jgi:D-alanyl-lipoteichoic acid acyltransferase DltB (MBOAT superfamily)
MDVVAVAWMGAAVLFAIIGCQHAVVLLLRRDVYLWRERLAKAKPNCPHPKKSVEYYVCQECGMNVSEE